MPNDLRREPAAPLDLTDPSDGAKTQMYQRPLRRLTGATPREQLGKTLLFHGKAVPDLSGDAFPAAPALRVTRLMPIEALLEVGQAAPTRPPAPSSAAPSERRGKRGRMRQVERAIAALRPRLRALGDSLRGQPRRRLGLLALASMSAVLALMLFRSADAADLTLVAPPPLPEQQQPPPSSEPPSWPDEEEDPPDIGADQLDLREETAPSTAPADPLERAAVDALATGDLAAASRAYEGLRERYPRRTEFAEAARILRARGALARP